MVRPGISIPRLERYLGREIFRPAAGVLVGLLVVVLVFYANQTLGQALSQSLPMGLVGALALLRVGIFLDVLIPIAMVLGIVVGLGRLQATHEITAMAAAGAGRWRIVRAVMGPVIIAAVLVAVVSMAFRPWAYSTLYSIQAEQAVRIDLGMIEPGRFEALGDFLIFAESGDETELRNVMVQQRDGRVRNVLRSQRLYRETDDQGFDRLVFSDNVSLYRLTPDDRSDLAGRFDRLAVLFTPPPPPVRERLRRAQPLNELIGSDDPLHRAEVQWRLHAPLSVLVLSLAAVGLSRINPRLGQSARVLSATLVVTVYFSMHSVLINWVEQAQIPALPGLFWLPVVMLMFLLARYWLLQRGPGPPL